MIFIKTTTNWTLIFEDNIGDLNIPTIYNFHIEDNS
jgi:hypothetical protein